MRCQTATARHPAEAPPGEPSVRGEPLQLLLEIGRAAGVGATFLERMAAVAPLVQRLLPHTHAAAWVVDPDAPATIDPAWYHGGGLMRPYAERWAAQDPMRPTYAAADGRPALLSDTDAGRAFGQEPFTGEFLAGLGVRHVMLCAQRMPDGAAFVFALHRGPERPDFDAQERALLALCAPDLARAACGPVLRRALLAHLRARPGVPPEAGHDLDLPLSVHGLAYDEQARVVHADLGLDLVLDPGTRSRLEAEVGGFLAARPAPGLAVDLPLRSDGGADVPARLVALDRRSGLAALAILTPAVVDSRFERLARDARLTARERQVAALAIEGLRNRDIAQRLGVGVDTVKWHLKTIFQKTKVRGRGGLAAIVLGRAA